MKTIQKSVLIWFSAQEMYDLVTAVDDYPQFLPWCDHAKVIEKQENGVIAEIGMALSGLKKSFTTQNTHILNQEVKIELLKGPFKALNGVWSFHALGDQRACRIELNLNYEFESIFGSLVGPLFDKIATTLVDAFVKRAEEVYGT